jgi:hypothetical protein
LPDHRLPGQLGEGGHRKLQQGYKEEPSKTFAMKNS